MKIEEAMNVIQKDSADNLRIMLALNTIFDAIRSGDYILIRKQEVWLKSVDWPTLGRPTIANTLIVFDF